MWSSDKDIQKIDNPLFQWVYQSTGSLNELWKSGVNKVNKVNKTKQRKYHSFIE
jgi:hypothetical protein